MIITLHQAEIAVLAAEDQRLLTRWTEWSFEPVRAASIRTEGEKRLYDGTIHHSTFIRTIEPAGTLDVVVPSHSKVVGREIVADEDVRVVLRLSCLCDEWGFDAASVVNMARRGDRLGFGLAGDDVWRAAGTGDAGAATAPPVDGASTTEEHGQPTAPEPACSPSGDQQLVPSESSPPTPPPEGGNRPLGGAGETQGGDDQIAKQTRRRGGNQPVLFGDLELGVVAPINGAYGRKRRSTKRSLSPAGDEKDLATVATTLPAPSHEIDPAPRDDDRVEILAGAIRRAIAQINADRPRTAWSILTGAMEDAGITINGVATP